MLFTDEYKTISAMSEGTFKDKGSKFLSFAIPVETESEVKEHLDILKKKYYDATHHCYSYILGFDKSATRVNDDGEPSGTAGRPINGQLLSYDLTNILVVVVRYYGGTKLGVPGLINAYKTATKEALDKANIITKVVREVYEIHFQYEQMNDVMKIVKDFNLEVINTDFGMDCVIKTSIRKLDINNVLDKFSNIKHLIYKYLTII